jgi:adenosylhomocysteinase
MLQEIDTIIRSAYSEKEYPVLSWQMANWNDTKPLQGLSVLDATPVFRNTLIKYKALLMAGANLSVGITDKLPADNAILDKLKKWGIPIISSQEKEKSFDLILDCAAFFSHLKARIGYVELTRFGVDIYRQKGDRVFMADSGKIKKIETCLGTGESYFRAMNQLGYNDWHNKKLLLLGSGKVGTGIILYSAKLGAKTTVITDISTIIPSMRKYIYEVIGLGQTHLIEKAISDADFIVTATGIKGAMEKICNPEIVINSSAILANMGVEDEYGESIPKSRVLAEKIAVNFLLEEPTLLKYIDATMALHNEGAAYLIKNRNKGVILPPAETENEMLSISGKNGLIANDLILLSEINMD